ncbi:MAG: hypothetical protein V2I43_02155 [Parvularcula sp.]|jgi:hypothetical protein|nr:hypothetical protein [Parvularcula sp.]
MAERVGPNLMGSLLCPSLQKADTCKKIERLMALWDKIEMQAGIVAGGAMFELPMKTARINQI